MCDIRSIVGICLMAAVPFVAGCDKSGGDASSNASVSTVAWVLDAEPAGALSVVETKASAAEGDQIVMRGRIGGRMEPLTDESSAFVVMDLEIPYCGEDEPCGCPTPWDYCCETPETKTHNSATILVVDASGAPTDSPSKHGFSALDEVIVVGTVGARPTKEVLTIKATGLYKVSSVEMPKE